MVDITYPGLESIRLAVDAFAILYNIAHIGTNCHIMNTFKKNTFDYYILLFFLISVSGWLWEAAIYLVREHQFVNRGILIGPWLPIYGTGSILLYLLLGRCRKKPRWVFVISLTVCSVLEYFSGYFLERMWGIKWWDYSGMFLNLNGHICLMSCLFFGVGGVFLLFFVIPVYTKLYNKISPRKRIALSLILLALFIMDAAYSADFPNIGRGITYKAAVCDTINLAFAKLTNFTT